jgi:AMMECR1 domain-containing protein
MSSLCASKAGISSGAWKTGECDIYVFTAEVFGEKPNHDPAS